MKKVLDFFPYLILILFVLWVSIPSSLFFKPVYYSVIDQQSFIIAESSLSNLFSYHRIDYRTQLVDFNNQVCSIHGSTIFNTSITSFYYENREDLMDCITRGEPPRAIYNSWSVMLFGIIPLRPVYMVLEEHMESGLFHPEL